MYCNYSFKYIEVLVLWVGKSTGGRRSLNLAKDFSLIVPITLDKVSVPFPVSIPLDNISIQTKLRWLKRNLLSALPRSWVDITPASDTDVIIICKASYHQILNSGRVQFTIHIQATFNWCVYFNCNLLNYTSCKVLHCIPCPLQDVKPL